MQFDVAIGCMYLGKKKSGKVSVIFTYIYIYIYIYIHISFNNLSRNMQEMIKTQQELNRDIRDIQIKQTSAMRDLFESTRQRNYDYLFVNIPVYDGANKDELETWLDQIEIACHIASWEQDIKKVALGKSKGVGIVKDEL